MKIKLLGIAWAVIAALSGCASVGPDNLRNGRPAYNDAILATSDEQLLQNIVRVRFNDSLGFLTVSTITSNVSVKATGMANVAIGVPGAYAAGNAIPFAGSVSTEQNPTIIYTPVAGDRLMRQFMGETPMDLVELLLNSAINQGQIWTALIRRVNGIRNPEFLDPPALEPDPRFTQLAVLVNALQREGALYWVKLGGAQTGHAMVLYTHSPASARDAARLLELVAVTKPASHRADLVVPIEFSAGSAPQDSLAIETRSLFHLLQLAAASIDIPDELKPITRSFSASGPAGKGIRIQSSATQPAQARLATQYRDRWYFIDDTDHSSKQWFFMLQLLTNAQLPDKSLGLTPLLTIPSSGR